MSKNLDEHIRAHPVVILAASVLLGMTLTGGAIVFLMTVTDATIVMGNRMILESDIERDYVRKSEYKRLEEYVQIILNQEQQTKYEEIATLREGFRILVDNLKGKSFVHPNIILTYNSYAKRFNVIFSNSSIPIFPYADETEFGGVAVMSAMMLAIAIVERKYLCTARHPIPRMKEAR